MKIVFPTCCGVDVHKSFLVATIIKTPQDSLQPSYQKKRFSTFNSDLNRFADWLHENDCLDVCMESTGKYWVPVFNILEKRGIRVTIANPKWVKAVKGNKDDTKDSKWIGDLFRIGLVKSSFIPAKDIRILRELTRYRYKLTSMKSSEKNRFQNAFTVCNVIVETDEDDTLPDEVLESAAGKNVTLKIKVGDSIFWEIDCRVIPKDASLQDISLKVSMNTQGIPSKVLCGLPGSHTFLQMTLGHDGLFGFPVKLRADVGRGNSGKWANLYYYNEETGKMEFETAARVTASGDAVFTMTHASQYAIVLDEKSHALSFQDVGEGAWFQGAVEYVYRAGLMAGTGDTTFEPNAKLTRAMTAQILYNLEGTPEVTGEATFTDMNTAPDWSMDAIAWAQDTGVVAGMGDNTFAPNLKVTREQFAQMLYNYAKYKKCDLTKAGDLTKFPDEVSISTWAENALSWANGNGLINGHENGTLDPQGNTVRGQAASILMNFDLNVVKSVA